MSGPRSKVALDSGRSTSARPRPQADGIRLPPDDTDIPPLGGTPNRGPVGIAVPILGYRVDGRAAHLGWKPDVDRPRPPIPRRPLPVKAKHRLIGPLPRPPCHPALESESALCQPRPSANARFAGCGQSAALPTCKPLDTRPGPMPSPARLGPDKSPPAGARLPRVAARGSRIRQAPGRPHSTRISQADRQRPPGSPRWPPDPRNRFSG